MKKFTTTEVIDLLNQMMMGEISFFEMVEEINQRVSEAEKPVRKFQKGDKVRIKDGVSSKTHGTVCPFFSSCMDGLIGITMTVSDYYNNETGYVVCRESGWRFHEDWLEPYTDEPKEGDLAIFWDYDKAGAAIRFYEGLEDRYHLDSCGVLWYNVIKFESKEQFNRFIKGEI